MILLTTFVGLCIQLVFADQVLYVSKSGYVAPCGSEEYPCVSLTAALHQVNSDSTINIDAGVYTGLENTNLVLPFYNISIRSPTKETIIDCRLNQESFALRAHNSIFLEGLTIANCSSGVLFLSSTPSQTISLKGVLISNCETGLHSQGGNVEISNTKILDSRMNSSNLSSGTGLLIEESDIAVESVIISHCYFEDIPRHSIFINAEKTEQIIITGSNFIETSGVYIHGGHGEISDSVFVGVIHTANSDYVIEIEYGTWLLEDITMTQELKGNLNASIYLRNTVARLHLLQVYVADSGIVLSSSSVNISDSFIQSRANGIIIEYGAETQYTNIHSTNIVSTDSSVSVTAIGGNETPHSFHMEDSSFKSTGGLRLAGDVDGCIISCSFSNIYAEHSIEVNGGDWLFMDVYVEESGGIYFTNGGHVVFTNSSFVDNVGDNGGALYFDGEQLEISKCLFRGNEAENDGGAVYLANSVRCVIEESVFESNVANNGAVLFCNTNGDTIVHVDEETHVESNTNRAGVDIPCYANRSQSKHQTNSHYLLLSLVPLLLVTLLLVAICCGLTILCYRSCTKHKSSSHDVYTQMISL